MSIRSILIIDDEPNICVLLEKFFKREGYKAYSAHHAEEAFKIIHTHHPDVIFLDIKLPEIDGIDILKTIKKISPEAIIVMISGHATENTARDSLYLGAFEYINKPIDLERVKELMAQIEVSKF